ncbi:hypothetical protein Rhopal_003464-T1 [Rhodotorula paludigena]|uniref:Uncharacterized protein n=1 Tax=Rhodotorula paludigena TaxID=86838 RepID=A0AAV5GJP2_9BASI|nr:hypothetical protein Rhopal_003464-T1 [Rhodotorula paludigena]
MSAASTYFVSGASRSLGLGYVRTLLESSPDVRVVAGVRNPSNASQLDALAALPANQGRVHIVAFDVDSEDSVKQAAEKLKSDPFLPNGALDAVIVNAGVFVGGFNPPSAFSVEDYRANFRTNVEGAIFTAQYLLPLLRKGRAKQVFFISSIVGSLAGPVSQSPGGVAYAMSKVALNMYGVKLGRELGPESFTVVLLHPGYVQTDMNAFNKGGDITTEEAVSKATKYVFLAATPEWNCRFVDYEGKPMDW